MDCCTIMALDAWPDRLGRAGILLFSRATTAQIEGSGRGVQPNAFALQGCFPPAEDEQRARPVGAHGITADS